MSAKYFVVILILTVMISCTERIVFEEVNTELQQVSAPTFDPPGGEYSESQQVTINCATEGAVIRYTTDGEEPTEESTVFTTAIDVSEDTTIKARAFKDDWNHSQTTSAQYIIDTTPPEDMVFVEGGTFSPDHVYTVNLSSFYIAKYEVTQAEWTSVMGRNPSYFFGNPSHPVESVSWFDAIEYCNRLSIREGLTPCYSYDDGTDHGTNPDNWPDGWNTDDDNHTNVSCNWEANGYRLPTEMEWKFAARGGVPAQNAGTFNDTWAGTNVEAELGDYAWFFRNSGDEWLDGDWDYDMVMGNNCRTHPVGTKLPNELGLYDMSGNVFNWVWDIWGSYPTGVHNNPTGPTSGVRRGLRGGSWFNYADGCHISYRYFSSATDRYGNFGFRVYRTLN